MSPPQDYDVSHIPTEIWDAVADELVRPADLARLALVNKRMHSIVVPNHLNYRAISSDIDNASLWKELSTAPIKARSVDSLVIASSPGAGSGWEWIHEDKCQMMRSQKGMRRVKSDLEDSFKLETLSDIIMLAGRVQDVLDSVELLPSLASNLVRLRSLGVCVSACQLVEFEPFFSDLAPSLESLEIHVEQCIDHDPSDEDMANMSEALDALAGCYERLRWTSVFNSENTHELLGAVAVLASKCPSLKQFEITIGVPGSVPQHGNEVVNLDALWGDEEDDFSELRVLRCVGVGCSISGFGEFYWTLDALEDLRLLGISAGALPLIPNNCLPSLQNVEIEGLNMAFLASLFMKLDDGSYRPIKSLSISMTECARGADALRVMNAFDALEDFCYHAGLAGTLRSLSYNVLSHSNYGYREARLLPWLKMIGRYINSIQHLTLQPPVKDAQSRIWLQTVSRFRNLRTLRSRDKKGFLAHFDGDCSSHLRTLEESCPRLYRVDRWVKIDKTWKLEKSAV